jgi:hypothetical protein
MAGIVHWIQAASTLYAPGEPFGGLGKGGLITVIVIAVIATATFVWIFRETRKRE